MNLSQQIFRSFSLLVIGTSLFGGLYILNSEVASLKAEAASISAPSVTLGDPGNPTCTVRIDGADLALSRDVQDRLWRTVIACEAAQEAPASPTPQRETPRVQPDIEI